MRWLALLPILFVACSASEGSNDVGTFPGGGARPGAGGGPAGGSSGFSGSNSGGAGGLIIDGGVPEGSVSLPDGSKTCGEQRSPIGYSPKTPDVVIAFDSSGSMITNRFPQGGTETRLAVEQRVLRDVVQRYQDRIRFGYEEFPINGAAEQCRPGGDTNCCASRVAVSPDLMNFTKVDTAMKPCGGAPSCSTSRIGTPTPDSLRVCREFYGTLNDGIAERFVLLSTDGEPTCVPAGTPGADACSAAEEQVKALAAAGIKTVVLGVSEEVAASNCLNRLALAGGVPRPGGPPHFYPGSDPAQLATYLDQIVTGIAKPSCLLDLTSAPPDPLKVAVYFDNKEVPWDPTHMNGWDYDAGSKTRVIIYGSYCTNLQGFLVKEIAVVYGCPPCTGAGCGPR